MRGTIQIIWTPSALQLRVLTILLAEVIKEIPDWSRPGIQPQIDKIMNILVSGIGTVDKGKEPNG